MLDALVWLALLGVGVVCTVAVLRLTVRHVARRGPDHARIVARAQAARQQLAAKDAAVRSNAGCNNDNRMG